MSKEGQESTVEIWSQVIKIFCVHKRLWLHKRDPRARRLNPHPFRPGRCFKASVHIFICRLDIRLRKNRSQKRSTDRRAEKAIEISRDAFIFFLSISYLRKDRIEIPALRHRPGINESRIRFLLLYFEAEVRKAKALG